LAPSAEYNLSKSYVYLVTVVGQLLRALSPPSVVNNRPTTVALCVALGDSETFQSPDLIGKKSKSICGVRTERCVALARRVAVPVYGRGRWPGAWPLWPTGSASRRQACCE